VEMPTRQWTIFRAELKILRTVAILARSLTHVGLSGKNVSASQVRTAYHVSIVNVIFASRARYAIQTKFHFTACAAICALVVFMNHLPRHNITYVT